jgi:hypothetical protein
MSDKFSVVGTNDRVAIVAAQGSLTREILKCVFSVCMFV